MKAAINIARISADRDVESYTYPNKIANSSRAIKTRFLQLVMLDLAANGQTGNKVSDNDIRWFSERVAADTGSPPQILTALQTISKDHQEAYKINLRNAGFGDNVPEALVPTPVSITAPQAVGFGESQFDLNADLSKMNSAELDAWMEQARNARGR
jgi:hypothetical protein